MEKEFHMFSVICRYDKRVKQRIEEIYHLTNKRIPYGIQGSPEVKQGSSLTRN